MLVYFSHPMSRIKEAEDMLKELSSRLTYIKFVRPIPINCKHHEYFYADTKLLLESDALFVFAPEPTIGVSCELAIFKTQKPYCPAIGYKCIKHGWFDRLLDYQFNSLDDVIQVFSNISLCLTIRKTP